MTSSPTANREQRGKDADRYVEPPRTLVLRSTTHVPAAWRERLGAAIDWTWTFQLTALPGRRARLHLRVRGRTAPWWLTATYHAVSVPADFVMAVGMLRGIKRRAESAPQRRLSGRRPWSAPGEVAAAEAPTVPVRGAPDRPAVEGGG